MNANTVKQSSPEAASTDSDLTTRLPTIDLDECALLLDIDGTLLDFAPTPASA